MYGIDDLGSKSGCNIDHIPKGDKSQSQLGTIQEHARQGINDSVHSLPLDITERLSHEVPDHTGTSLTVHTI